MAEIAPGHTQLIGRSRVPFVVPSSVASGLARSNADVKYLDGDVPEGMPDEAFMDSARRASRDDAPAGRSRRSGRAKGARAAREESTGDEDDEAGDSAGE